MNFIKSLFKPINKEKEIQVKNSLKNFSEWANTDKGKEFIDYLFNIYYLHRTKTGTISEDALIHKGQLQVINFLIKTAYHIDFNEGEFDGYTK